MGLRKIFLRFQIIHWHALSRCNSTGAKMGYVKQTFCRGHELFISGNLHAGVSHHGFTQNKLTGKSHASLIFFDSSSYITTRLAPRDHLIQHHLYHAPPQDLEEVEEEVVVAAVALAALATLVAVVLNAKLDQLQS